VPPCINWRKRDRSSLYSAGENGRERKYYSLTPQGSSLDQHALVVVVGRIGTRRHAAEGWRGRRGGHGKVHDAVDLVVRVGDEHGPVSRSVAVVERGAELAAGDERGWLIRERIDDADRDTRLSVLTDLVFSI
jgi:hypothetical protein